MVAVVVVLLVAATVVVRSCGDEDRGSDAAPPATLKTTDPPAPSTVAPTSEPGPPPTVPGHASAEPVWASDFPDPFVLVDEGRYYAYATEAGLLRIQRLEGDSPRSWRDLGDALPVTPPWAAPFSTWAPAVVRLGSRYYLFYSGLVKNTPRHCIGRAVADDPAGPFVDDSTQPFLCPLDLGGAIDPSPFVDDDGRAYLLWKNDGITLRREASLWSLPLDADGNADPSGSVRLVGTDQRWEYPHIEGPSMTRVGDSYWLAYSGNWWNLDAYGVGLARCTGPAGPCEKPFDRPVLASRPGAWGPGGLEFFRDPDNRLFVAYHAWLDEPGYPGARALFVDPVDDSTGIPVIPS